MNFNIKYAAIIKPETISASESSLEYVIIKMNMDNIKHIRMNTENMLISPSNINIIIIYS